MTDAAGSWDRPMPVRACAFKIVEAIDVMSKPPGHSFESGNCHIKLNLSKNSVKQHW